METAKPSFLLKVFLFCVFLVLFRFAYILTIRGEICFFSSTANPTKSVRFYSSVFQHLISDGILSLRSKSLCVDTPAGSDVFALRQIGVLDSTRVSKNTTKPLVVAYQNRLPFAGDSFDFIFSGGGSIHRIASEVARTLKPRGFLVVHTRSSESYTLRSLIDLFPFSFVKSRELKGFDPEMLYLREVVLEKDRNWGRKCPVSEYRRELVGQVEALISEEPLKPWLTLKRNIQNIKYLTYMVDTNFKGRYVYVDVGARSYSSSIGSWFRKRYPNQNRTFEVFAVEADKSFYDDYKSRNGVTLLPYAAWVKNESLHFEINHDPGDDRQWRDGEDKAGSVEGRASYPGGGDQGV